MGGKKAGACKFLPVKISVSHEKWLIGAMAAATPAALTFVGEVTMA